MEKHINRSFRLPASWAPHLMPFLLSTFMSGLVSLVVTIKMHEFGSHSLFLSWLNSWGSSWIIAYPSLLVVLPVVKWIVASVTHPPETQRKGH